MAPPELMNRSRGNYVIQVVFRTSPEKRFGGFSSLQRWEKLTEGVEEEEKGEKKVVVRACAK